jgi:predicted amidohydrolase
MTIATEAEGVDVITIAATQYPPTLLADLGAYKDKLAQWVGDAVQRRAQLLVFPEYGAMEYAGAFGVAAHDLTASLQAVSDALPEMDAAHATLARQHGLHILAASGPQRLPDGRTVNAARLFAPSGRMGVQHKLMMTPFERNWGISPGAGQCVFATTLGRIGIAICYDSEFPVLVRAQCEAGAEIVLVPACTEFISGYHRVRTAALARALENGCVTVQSPTVGHAPWSPAIDVNVGAAGIFAPAERGLSDTGVLAEGDLNRPGLISAVVDLGQVRRIRASGEMRNSSDWALQPGVVPLAHTIERVDLR